MGKKYKRGRPSAEVLRKRREERAVEAADALRERVVRDAEDVMAHRTAVKRASGRATSKIEIPEGARLTEPFEGQWNAMTLDHHLQLLQKHSGHVISGRKLPSLRRLHAEGDPRIIEALDETKKNWMVMMREKAEKEKRVNV